jgi:flagellar biosynthetic protein FliR
MKFSSEFLRCSALFLTSPLFGKMVPVRIRIGITLLVALALVPALKTTIGTLPDDMNSLVLRLLYELLIGAIIGMLLHFLLFAAQMAGNIIDYQIGLGSAQLLNPQLGTTVTLVSQFQYMLALILFFIFNGHHQVFEAIVKSYEVQPIVNGKMLGAMTEILPKYVTHLTLLAFQIAIPVAGVGLVVDAASGIVNKAVPQMQIYTVAMPAKILVGLFMLSVALPILSVAVQNGLEQTWNIVFQVLSSGRR